MSLNADIVGQVKTAIDQANDIFVLFPGNAGPDVVGASLALAGSLQARGKNVAIASPQELTEAATRLPLSDQVSQKIGNRNLVISLKVGSRDSIDKVSYNLEEDGSTFNLVIQPKKGQAPLKSEDVSFSYAGAAADLVIMIGATRFEDMQDFYVNERKLFTEATTINIHRYTASKFATYHLDDPRAGALSEIMYKLMHDLNLTQTKATATNLLAGIDTATGNLMAPTVTADTFEAVANLLRAGGLRQTYGDQAVSQTPPMAPTVTEMNPPTPIEKTPVPQEWLTPKIYKSSDTSKS
jgi:nanoRNase/pAp phosphatase (c-di-AMP/oligoRNAs hydrolase)